MKRAFFGGLAALAILAMPALAGSATAITAPAEVRLMSEARGAPDIPAHCIYAAETLEHAIYFDVAAGLCPPAVERIALPLMKSAAPFKSAVHPRPFSARSRHRSG